MPAVADRTGGSAFGVPHSRFVVRPGAVLLEVVLALGLFVLAAALVGGAIRGGLVASERMAHRTRALGLAESLLDQIRAKAVVADDGAEGDFSPQFPQYRYRLGVRQGIEQLSDLASIQQVTVTVSWDVPGDVGQAPMTDSVTLVGWLHQPPAAEEPAGGGAEGASGSPSSPPPQPGEGGGP